MKFRYFRFPLPESSEIFGTTILKPIIPVELVTVAKTIRYAALIDSGADFCIFDGEIGEVLGLDVRAGRQTSFGGVQDTGASVAYFHDIGIRVGGQPFHATVAFSYEIAKHGYGILGQKGFFDLFSVKFDFKAEEIELKEK